MRKFIPSLIIALVAITCGFSVWGSHNSVPSPSCACKVCECEKCACVAPEPCNCCKK